WGVHEEFMRVMARGVQRSDPWLFNNSLYVTAENMNLLRNLSDNAIRWGLLLRLLALLTKPLVLAICAYLVVKSRALKLLEAARRHFDLLIAVAFCLLISRTVWDHYLTAIFPLLIYVVALRRYFSREALVLVGAIFPLSIGQNMIFNLFLAAHFRFDTTP